MGGRKVLRFACGGIEQTEADVMEAWSVIKCEAKALVEAKYPGYMDPQAGVLNI